MERQLAKSLIHGSYLACLFCANHSETLTHVCTFSGSGQESTPTVAQESLLSRIKQWTYILGRLNPVNPVCNPLPKNFGARLASIFARSSNGDTCIFTCVPIATRWLNIF
jgi:hypothetical protein